MGNIIELISVWGLCGFLQYLLIYGYFSNKYPYIYESRWPNILNGLLGPIALIACLWFLIDTNGFKSAFKYGIKL